MSRVSRRSLLRLASVPLAARTGIAAAPSGLSLELLRHAAGRIIPADTSADVRSVLLKRDWSGDLCRPRITNTGTQSVRIREVVLFSVTHTLPPETPLYGESFHMLSQTGGTLGAPLDLGYSERKHYKIPQPADATALSGMLLLSPRDAFPILLAFTSCRRFLGRFYLRPASLDVVVDTEGLELAPGQSWDLEEFTFVTGKPEPELLSNLARRIGVNHPPLQFPKPPTGWCSWYCFGPRVTAKQVLDNLEVIAKEMPGLRYVQIDDGYQPAMGDWLDTGAAFGGDVLGVLKQIRQRGFEPAIWVAPFIAESGSKLFRQHPDWFMKGVNGEPLPANQVTFGGWRRGPWYALDGTHPEVQQHLESLFRTMRQDWGCTYFKLDANFWGAMHGGRLHDSRATRIEAYRLGMQAIRKGAGDGFLLGCNHPIWPSFGLIHGSRSSADISRKWSVISEVARQNLNRNWQNGRLWWNDPDALVLTGGLSTYEILFHATATYASGGMILSGDDLTTLPPNAAKILRKMLPPAGKAAEFQDRSLKVGHMQTPQGDMICAFNWTDHQQTLTVRLPRSGRLIDYWTDEPLGRRKGSFQLANMPPHSARLFLLR